MTCPFSEIFSLPESEHTRPWIYLKGVPSHQLRYVIDFLYAGEVEVPEADLSLFLATAGELKIRGLTKYAGGVPALATRTLDTADTETEDNIVIPSAASGNLHKVNH